MLQVIIVYLKAPSGRYALFLCSSSLSLVLSLSLNSLLPDCTLVHSFYRSPPTKLSRGVYDLCCNKRSFMDNRCAMEPLTSFSPYRSCCRRSDSRALSKLLVAVSICLCKSWTVALCLIFVSNCASRMECGGGGGGDDREVGEEEPAAGG